MTMTYTMQPSLVSGLYAANIRNIHGTGGIHGMGSVWDDLASFANDKGSLSDKISAKFTQGTNALKAAATNSGVGLTGDLMTAMCDKMRPAAAAKLGKKVTDTTDEDVMAYMASLPMTGLSKELAAVAKEKADTAIYMVAGVGVLVAAAIYFGMRGRKGGGAVKANGRRRRRSR